MVRGSGGEGQEEDHQGADICHPCQKTKNVKLSGMEGSPGQHLYLYEIF